MSTEYFCYNVKVLHEYPIIIMYVDKDGGKGKKGKEAGGKKGGGKKGKAAKGGDSKPESLPVSLHT